MSASQASDVCSTRDRLTTSEKAYLSLSQLYRCTHRAMANALGLKKLAEYISGSICFDDPVFVLSLRHPRDDEEKAEESGRQKAAQELLMSDLAAKLWFTYRTGFQPLGADQLTSDVGWGCTLRSCQMMLAQALVMHFLGRLTSLPEKWRPTLQFIINLLHDSPDAQHAFSIHSICRAGAVYGLVPGKWMGPYAICRAFQDLGEAHLSGFLKIVTVDSGGGVPCLDPARLSQAFRLRCSARQDLYAWPDRLAEQTGLLVLLPVVLGVDHLNEVYAEQLKMILRLPQSVGIVGGKPGHSLYFIGYQDKKLLYLDPHDVQPTESPPELASHSSDAFVTVSTSAIDSTMAIGFYCHSEDELQDLCRQISAMSEKHRKAPLLCVGASPEPLSHLNSEALGELDDDNFGNPGGSPVAVSGQGQSEGGAQLGAGQSSAGDDWELVG